MFGGSKNVPDFDKSLQKVGAENNAFTNSDITNYYMILSSENIETALWAESDRMQHLTLDAKNLENQKNVVVEEFKQQYLNVPYGDVYLKLRPLAYHTHPYRWPTIGRKIEHIEQASLLNVQEFHEQFYAPNNAVLSISGNIDHEIAVELSEKWFGNIPACNTEVPQIPVEPIQTSARFLECEENVPLSSIYKAYHMPARINNKYLTSDLLSDLLGRGKASRLYQGLVKNKKIFTSINAYITGTADPGLLIIAGKINPSIDITEAEKHIEEEIDQLKNQLKEREVEKVINQAVSSTFFSETELLNRSIGLSVANSIGNTNLVNEEIETISKTTSSELVNMANEILVPSNCSTLHYKSNKINS